MQFWFSKLIQLQGPILIAESPLHVVVLSLSLDGDLYQACTSSKAVKSRSRGAKHAWVVIHNYVQGRRALAHGGISHGRA